MISPYVRQLRLAAEIRRVRVEAGMTHDQLAELIGPSRAAISRLENGHNVDQDVIIQILDALDVDEDRWNQILTIARDAAEHGWWESNKAMGPRQALYANLEAGANAIREYQITFVPGLLQTPEFTRARVEAANLIAPSGSRPNKVVDARAGRQRMLRRPGGPMYEVIIDEVAIRRPAAPPEIVKAQLYYLAATVNGNPKIAVRILPVDAVIEAYSVPRSAFSIYTFTDPGDPVVVAVDTVTDDLILTDEGPVDRYDQLYGRLRDAALSEDDSIDFLINAAEAMPDHREETPPQ
ncbi:helix-turn-helix transcriptional regulator [Actinomadura sp. HBU206391]|uniref:helix-turn-helix domain-containing protein n=1 Tax=Actinomadura sp. HBU206391 TaxID=2731692 RepID=UPI00164EEA98|nr:helix-turn-helix transcriptional regulator [Actinomadura sp. HBU206391]MBC6462742.1 helix-turn-helix transcriptional regulator [Actinomadura sp. HBU206391]